MGLIREPLDVDLYIGGHRRVTQKELDEISEFIRNQKLQAAKSATATVRNNAARSIALKKKKQLA